MSTAASSPKEERVEFSGRVPVELRDRFVQKFPMFGSNSWFICTALNAFLDELEGSPELTDVIRTKMVSEMAGVS